ncbi:MAG: HD domain-containing protein [Bacteroidota bacterium]|nr:HD domain-containing protein [Bacteroidota bacterium]
MELPKYKYNETFLTRKELEALLKEKNFSALDINLALDAYEMAESVHEGQKRPDGTPYFWHPSRVAKIAISELDIRDINFITAALLHDVLEDSQVITAEILEYNFSPYTSYLVQMLTKDIKAEGMLREIVEKEYVERLSGATEDARMLKLCDRLDTFRCLEFNVKKNPIKYVMETTKHYFPLAEGSDNPKMQYLVKELQTARNKFLG